MLGHSHLFRGVRRIESISFSTTAKPSLLRDRHGSLTATTVSDSATNLTWTRNFPGLFNYAQAMAACASFGGHIPNDSQLETYASEQTACNGQVTWARPPAGSCVWSSTAFDGGGAHDCVYFDGSATQLGFDGDGHYTLCVK
jgi:hypothetical protein